ncbi:MAG: MoaD/ThiS family protein, partial [Proteobacteria bacterium]|nr:MoaD/ThiS family protein [Pseudomonadota bacterium]
MATVLFNAFSFLQKELKAQNRPYANASIDVAEGTTVTDLVNDVGLEVEEIEAVFVNGSVTSFDAILHHGDRVALVPPGTPGP